MMSEISNGHILIVEDDHDIRVAVRQSLEMANYIVHSAPNGRDALKLIRKQRPDLIILDMVMPLMDGEEFLRTKDNDETIRDIPVMLISAYEDKLKIQAHRPHLKKPLDLDMILEKVPQILSTKLSPA